jgi:hypothetical protein
VATGSCAVAWNGFRPYAPAVTSPPVTRPATEAGVLPPAARADQVPDRPLEPPAKTIESEGAQLQHALPNEKRLEPPVTAIESEDRPPAPRSAPAAEQSPGKLALQPTFPPQSPEPQRGTPAPAAAPALRPLSVWVGWGV